MTYKYKYVKKNSEKLFKTNVTKLFIILPIVVSLFCIIGIVNLINRHNIELYKYSQKISELQGENLNLLSKIGGIKYEMQSLKNEHRLCINKIQSLEKEIKYQGNRKTLINHVKNVIKQSAKNTDLYDVSRAAIAYSFLYDIRLSDLLAQIRHESNFDPNAISPTGARGLMQVVDSTAKEISIDLNRKNYDINSIITNVEFGTYYMSKMLKKSNNNYLDALRMYSYGPKNVKKLKEKIDFIEQDPGKAKVDKHHSHYPLWVQGYIELIYNWQQYYQQTGVDTIQYITFKTLFESLNNGKN